MKYSRLVSYIILFLMTWCISCNKIDNCNPNKLNFEVRKICYQVDNLGSPKPAVLIDTIFLNLKNTLPINTKYFILGEVNGKKKSSFFKVTSEKEHFYKLIINTNGFKYWYFQLPVNIYDEVIGLNNQPIDKYNTTILLNYAKEYLSANLNIIIYTKNEKFVQKKITKDKFFGIIRPRTL